MPPQRGGIPGSIFCHPNCHALRDELKSMRKEIV